MSADELTSVIHHLGCDSDRDGHISREEFQMMCERIGVLEAADRSVFSTVFSWFSCLSACTTPEAERTGTQATSSTPGNDGNSSPDEESDTELLGAPQHHYGSMN